LPSQQLPGSTYWHADCSTESPKPLPPSRWRERVREPGRGRRAAEAAVDLERTGLDSLAFQVERLREEVHRMVKELDALLVWERYCPTCGRGVRRESISEVARCGCGWVWE